MKSARADSLSIVTFAQQVREVLAKLLENKQDWAVSGIPVKA